MKYFYLIIVFALIGCSEKSGKTFFNNLNFSDKQVMINNTTTRLEKHCKTRFPKNHNIRIFADQYRIEYRCHDDMYDVIIYTSSLPVYFYP